MIFVFLFNSCTEMFESSNPIKRTNIYSGKYRDLIEAINDEDLVTIERIVKLNHINLNYADAANGVSLLNWCIFNEKEKSFEKLLRLGADANWQDTGGEFAPPITEAAQVDGNANYLKLSLLYGGNVNLISKKVEGPFNQTPLFAAMLPVNNWDNLKIVVEHGANVNLTPVGYWSPLTEACLVSEIETAKYLIDHGADYNQVKFRLPDGGEMDILDFLRVMTFSINSQEYKIKMEVAAFLKTKGLDYWKAPVPKGVKDRYMNDSIYLSKY